MAKKAVDKRSKKASYTREIVKLKPLGRPAPRMTLSKKSPPPVNKA